MELFEPKKLEDTQAYKYFQKLKKDNVPYDLAIAKAISQDIGKEDELIDGQLNIIRKMVYYGYYPSSYLTPSEIEKAEELKVKQDYYSNFNFLNRHFGLRKGSIHLILGDTGKGKSSLVRSIAVENTTKNNVFILLSEETVSSYNIKLNETNVNYKRFIFDEKQSENILNTNQSHIKTPVNTDLTRIKCASELEQNFDSERDFNQFFIMIKDFIKRDNIKLFIYDNFSTGLFSENFKYQKDAIKKFKEIANEYNIPIIILIHPKKSAHFEGTYLTPDSIRGNSALATMPEFIYSMNMCEIDEGLKNYLLITKSRDYDFANRKWFELRYTTIDGKNGTYTGDFLVQESVVLENLKNSRKKNAK